MEGVPDRTPRTRPVAGVPPIDEIDCAKRWLIELIASAPLQKVASVPVAELARDAPPLCAAVIDAVRSDEALTSLEGSSAASAIRRLTGDTDPAGIVASVDALRRALRMALAARIPEPPASLAADLSDRLAYVCSILSERSLADARAVESPEDEDFSDPIEDRGPPIREPEVDQGHPLRFARRGTAQDRPSVTSVAENGAEPWVEAIARRMHGESGEDGSFGVLAIEIDDLDRLVAGQAGKEVAIALEAAERALSTVLSSTDEIIRQGLGHHRIVTDESDPLEVRELGERLAAAVSAGASLAGSPLTVSVGVAVWPNDGSDEADLAARADERLFAARAAGVRLV